MPALEYLNFMTHHADFQEQFVEKKDLGRPAKEA
jgi:hypothetical protein